MWGSSRTVASINSPRINPTVTVVESFFVMKRLCQSSPAALLGLRHLRPRPPGRHPASAEDGAGAESQLRPARPIAPALTSSWPLPSGLTRSQTLLGRSSLARTQSFTSSGSTNKTGLCAPQLNAWYPLWHQPQQVGVWCSSTINQPIGQPVINPRGSTGNPNPRDPLQPLRCNRSEPESRLTDLNRWPSLYKSAALPLS